MPTMLVVHDTPITSDACAAGSGPLGGRGAGAVRGRRRATSRPGATVSDVLAADLPAWDSADLGYMSGAWSTSSTRSTTRSSTRRLGGPTALGPRQRRHRRCTVRHRAHHGFAGSRCTSRCRSWDRHRRPWTAAAGCHRGRGPAPLTAIRVGPEPSDRRGRERKGGSRLRPVRWSRDRTERAHGARRVLTEPQTARGGHPVAPGIEWPRLAMCSGRAAGNASMVRADRESPPDRGTNDASPLVDTAEAMFENSSVRPIGTRSVMRSANGSR